MSEHINIVAVLTVQPGKLDVLIDAFNAVTQAAKDNEPDTLVYYQFVIAEKNQVVAVERYKNKAALDTHMVSPPVVKLVEILPGLLDKPGELLEGAHPSAYPGLLRA